MLLVAESYLFAIGTITLLKLEILVSVAADAKFGTNVKIGSVAKINIDEKIISMQKSIKIPKLILIPKLISNIQILISHTH